MVIVVLLKGVQGLEHQTAQVGWSAQGELVALLQAAVPAVSEPAAALAKRSVKVLVAWVQHHLLLGKARRLLSGPQPGLPPMLAPPAVLSCPSSSYERTRSAAPRVSVCHGCL